MLFLFGKHSSVCICFVDRQNYQMQSIVFPEEEIHHYQEHENVMYTCPVCETIELLWKKWHEDN